MTTSPGPTDAEIAAARRDLAQLDAGLSFADARTLAVARGLAVAVLDRPHPLRAACGLIDEQLVPLGPRPLTLTAAADVGTPYEQVLRTAGVTAAIVSELEPWEIREVFDQYALVFARRPGAMLRQAAARQHVCETLGEPLDLRAVFHDPRTLEQLAMGGGLLGYAVTPDHRLDRTALRQVLTVQAVNGADDFASVKHDVVLIEEAENGHRRARVMAGAAAPGTRVRCVSCGSRGGTPIFDDDVVLQETIAARLATPRAKHTVVAIGPDNTERAVEMIDSMPPNWRPDTLVAVATWHPERDRVQFRRPPAEVPLIAVAQPDRPFDPALADAWRTECLGAVDLDAIRDRRPPTNGIPLRIPPPRPTHRLRDPRRRPPWPV